MQSVALMPNSVIDLQLHTIYSDGLWTPEALIDHLIAERFAVAAITDHDRMDTVWPLQKMANKKNFFLLMAVEMSTHWGDALVDVLCYGRTIYSNSLQDIAAHLLERQQDNIRQTVEAIRQHGCHLPPDDLSAILEKPAVQQPHALVSLVDQHYRTAERSGGRRLIEAGLKQITTEIGEVVKAAHESGWRCVIAHPGRGDGFLCFDEALLDQLRAEVRIDGLEVYYPKHTSAQTALYRSYAEQHNLLISAGSDSHTPDTPPIKYEAALCEKLLRRLDIFVIDD